jgi:hypothetical protein
MAVRIKDNKVPEHYMFSSFFNKKELILESVRSFSYNAEKSDPIFLSKYRGTIQQFDQELIKELDPLISGFANEAFGEPANADRIEYLRKGMGNQIKNLVIAGFNKKDALEKVKAEWMTNNYNFLQLKSENGSYHIILPKEFNNQQIGPDQMGEAKKNLDYYKTPAYLKTLFGVPKGMEENSDRYYVVVSKSVRYIRAQDGKSVDMIYYPRGITNPISKHNFPYSEIFKQNETITPVVGTPVKEPEIIIPGE